MDVSSWSVLDYLDYFKSIESEIRVDLKLINDDLQRKGLESDLKNTVDMQKEIIARLNEGACCEIVEVKQTKEGDTVTEIAVLYMAEQGALAAKVCTRTEVSEYRYLTSEDKVSEALVKEVLTHGMPMVKEDRILLFGK